MRGVDDLAPSVDDVDLRAVPARDLVRDPPPVAVPAFARHRGLDRRHYRHVRTFRDLCGAGVEQPCQVSTQPREHTHEQEDQERQQPHHHSPLHRERSHRIQLPCEDFHIGRAGRTQQPLGSRRAEPLRTLGLSVSAS